MRSIVYPLTVQIDYTELKYSLRSLQKFLPQPFEVLIIGDHLPDWINNVTQIELPDVKSKKQWSIRRKILAALEYTEEILFMNDDVYLLTGGKVLTDNNDGTFFYRSELYNYYWHGMLKNYSEPGSKPLFKQLEAQGKTTKHFDGHYPIIYGQDFKELSKHFTDDCIIKSMYANYLGIEGTFVPDCKLIKETKPEEVRNFIKNKSCFSTGVYSLKSALPILQELFPSPSKYEI